MSDTDTGKPLDMQRIAKTVDGSEDLFRMLIEHLVTDDRDAASSLAGALEKGDMESVRREAHRLKSALKSLAADKAAQSALALEEAATDGNTGTASVLVDNLVEQIDLIGTFYQSGGWKQDFAQQEDTYDE